ncbi:MAG: hypothetical protein A2283_05050 [Lentisphaerae bacterium RIFOXYA12_FULL_48_11]|nr:MAG: hypothetical protein A2283_05050 [Lentisphaerae bacterium RIFOXYA12_FULL_48_11]
MSENISRRKFVEGSLIVTAGGALAVNGGIGQALAQDGKPVNPKVVPGSKNTLPKGKIGNFEMSRVLLGGNLLNNYTHTHSIRFAGRLAKYYNTLEKKLETLALAESCGIDTIGIHTHAGTMDMLQKYKNEWGGTIKIMASPTSSIDPDLKAYFDESKRVVDNGVEAIFIWGNRSEQMLKAGRMGDLIKMVEFVKELGIPSGVCAHDLNVIKQCEKEKVPCDFYIKTLHHLNYPTAKINHDSCWCSNPEETIEFMKTVEKPWIAFKIMAAGGIPPQDAFPYAFNNGADFVLAGMFDFDIEEDVKITKEAVTSAKRDRPWRS